MADTAAKGEAGNESDELCQKTKRAKVETENGGGEAEKESEPGRVLSGFQLTAVLSDSAREKNIFIHGKVSSVSVTLANLNSKGRFLIYINMFGVESS